MLSEIKNTAEHILKMHCCILKENAAHFTFENRKPPHLNSMETFFSSSSLPPRSILIATNWTLAMNAHGMNNWFSTYVLICWLISNEFWSLAYGKRPPEWRQWNLTSSLVEHFIAKRIRLVRKLSSYHTLPFIQNLFHEIQHSLCWHHEIFTQNC